MQECDVLIANATVVTCASPNGPKKGVEMADVGIVLNGGVAVKDGIILAVGNSEQICSEFTSLNLIRLSGNAVSPAFTECHTHIVFGGDRLNEFELKIKGAAYLDILAAGGGILSTVKNTRNASLDQLVENGRLQLNKLLSNGVLNCEIKTGYGLDVESELKMLEAILRLDKICSVDVVPTFLPAHAVPPEFKDKPDDYVDLIVKEMLPRAVELAASYGKSAEDVFVDVFCEKGAFDLSQSRRVLKAAKDLGFSLKAHVDEFTNLGGARMAIELGACSIDHLDAISDEEIELLSDSNTIGVVTPTVNFNLGSTEFANARKLIDSDCAVAVSTDFNPGSAPCPSIPMAMAIACRYQKLTPAEAFNGATINAAHAIGRGKSIGSIEVGKNADLLIWNTKDYRQIAYEFGGLLLHKRLKNGQPLENCL